MQRPGTQRAGGIVLVTSAVVLAAGAMLGGERFDSLAAYREGGMSVLAPWLMTLAGLLWVGGAAALARGFDGTRSEIWATLGRAGALFGGVGLFLGGAIGTFGFPGLATGTLMEHTTEAYTALSYGNLAIGMMGVTAYFAAVALFGVAMVRSDAWPGWLGWSGVAVGALVLAMHLTDPGAFFGAAAMALYMLGLVWVALAGWTLARSGRSARADGEPVRTEPAT